MLRAVYDLGRSPLTFDFVHWLAAVERARLAAGEPDVRVCFKAGDRDLTERDQHFTNERKAWRLQNLLVPLCRLLPSVSGYEVNASGEQQQSYKLDGPVKPEPILKSSRAAQSVMAAWLRTDLPVVTITIRQSDLQAQRNSNIPEWVKVADWLEQHSAKPVFVPDTEAMMTGEPMDFGGHAVCDPAAMNVDLRLALYERAVLNCFTSGGPFGLALYAGLPFLLCKTIFPDIRSCTEGVQERLGYTPERFQGPYRRIVWCDDTFDAVQPVIKQMLPDCLAMEREMPELHAFAVQKPMRIQNVQACFERNLPQMQQVPIHQRTMALVCYGPTIKETWRLLPQSGEDVFTVSGAHDFLIERGIIPTGHIECDPRPHKAEFTRRPDPRVTYYLSSTCHPAVFDNVPAEQVRLWHAWDGDEVEAAVLKLWPNAFTLLGGSNVGLRAIAVGSALGYRKFSVYGMDCSLTDSERHAGPHGGKAQTAVKVRPMLSEREFQTTRQMISGAREMVSLVASLKAVGFEFTVHGDSLLMEMLRCALKLHEQEQANKVPTGESNGTEGRSTGVCPV